MDEKLISEGKVDIENIVDSPYEHIKEEEEDSKCRFNILLDDGHGKGGEHGEGHSSYIAAAFHIINTIMGAGILSIPVVFRYLGIVLGAVFIFLIASVNIFSVHLLLKCKDMTKKNGYAMFAKITYGAAGSLLVKIIIIINNFGMCCAYFRIFGETSHNLAAVFFDKTSFFVNNWNNFFYILIIFTIMSVLIFKNNLDSLKSASFLGVTGISIFFICLVIIFFYKLSNNLIEEFDSSILWPSGSFLDIVGVLPTIFLAFTFQFNAFPVYFSLRKRTNQEMVKSTFSAISFCCVLYLITGFLGYYMYRKKLQDTILQALTLDVEAYKDSDNFLIVILLIVNIAFLVSSTMSIPLMFFSLKNNFINAIIFCKKKFSHSKISVNEEEKLLHSVRNSMDVTNDKCTLNQPGVNNETTANSWMSNTTRNIIIIVLYICIGTIAIVVPGLKIVS